MPHTNKKARQADGLRRFAAVQPSRAQDEPMLDALVAAGLLPSRPILNALWRAWGFWRSGRTDTQGRALRSLGPDPFRVLALAREKLLRDRARIDRDVALWALWTFCQSPERAMRGRPAETTAGDRGNRAELDLVLFTFKTDLLTQPAFAGTFRGSRKQRTLDVHRAIKRVADLVEKADTVL